MFLFAGVLLSDEPLPALILNTLGADISFCPFQINIRSRRAMAQGTCPFSKKCVTSDGPNEENNIIPGYYDCHDRLDSRRTTLLFL